MHLPTHPRHVLAGSLLAALLGLAGCGERTDGQTVGQKVDQAIAKTAEAGREIKENSKEAGKDLGEAAQKAGAKVSEEAREVAATTREATADARARTSEATAEGKTAVMGAAGETKQASSTLGQKVDDALITSRVNAGFAADTDLSALKIDVDTRDGVVTLKGEAPNPTAKSRATEIAKAAKDVKSVDNQLRVKAG